MTDPRPHESPRRAARAAAELAAADAQPSRSGRRLRRIIALAGAAVLVVGGGFAVAAALSGPVITETSGAILQPDADDGPIAVQIVPLPEDGLPAPTMTAQAAGTQLCSDPAVTDALAAGDDGAVIAAAGGAAAFRTAVATGAAPCVALDDPNRVWVVVNKQRPYAPIDFTPSDLIMPADVRSLEQSALRRDAADGLTALVQAAAAAGAGEIASESAYRSYSTQQVTYAGHVSSRGVEGADLVSARPGYSEHQSGLTVDVVPCDGSCATIDDLAGSPQGDWVVDHAWEYGWIVRYEEGRTDVTGYVPEPWHLRYLGVDLARAYHEGEWTTLEEFFGLPAAPDYTD